jgi:hypothetical protein
MQLPTATAYQSGFIERQLATIAARPAPACPRGPLGDQRVAWASLVQESRNSSNDAPRHSMTSSARGTAEKESPATPREAARLNTPSLPRLIAHQPLYCLPRDRSTSTNCAVQRVLVGQFRTAGGLVLLSGGSWGLRFPAARTGDKRPGRMIVTERLQAAN